MYLKLGHNTCKNKFDKENPKEDNKDGTWKKGDELQGKASGCRVAQSERRMRRNMIITFWILIQIDNVDSEQILRISKERATTGYSKKLSIEYIRKDVKENCRNWMVDECNNLKDDFVKANLMQKYKMLHDDKVWDMRP